jgi:hypothetical protein
MEDCNCRQTVLSPRAPTPIRDFIQQRAIILRYGCLCSRVLTGVKVKFIGNFLGISDRTVEKIMYRHRKLNFIWTADKRKENGRATTYTPRQMNYITRYTTLNRQRHMTLNERSDDLSKHLINISPRHLGTIYKKHRISYRRVDVCSIYKFKQRAEIQRMQVHYRERILKLELDKYVYFMDETSINLWCITRKTWTGQEHPVTLPMQPSRLSSQTIIAAVGGDPVDVIYQLGNRTQSTTVIAFLELFIQK